MRKIQPICNQLLYMAISFEPILGFQNLLRFRMFKFPLDREVDEGVRMVMHQGVLINSKTEWFSPSIVRTTIETGGGG